MNSQTSAPMSREAIISTILKLPDSRMLVPAKADEHALKRAIARQLGVHHLDHAEDKLTKGQIDALSGLLDLIDVMCDEGALVTNKEVLDLGSAGALSEPTEEEVISYVVVANRP